MRKLLTALPVAALLLGVFAVAVDAQTTYQRFENVWAHTLRSTGALTVGGAAAISGALTGATANFTGNVSTDGTFSADGTISGQAGLSLIPGASITVTDGGIITPTTAIQELTAAGSVGAELAACGDGQVQTFVNLSNQTITITDTGTVHLAGNAALGQYDSLTVVGSGVRCIEIARANN